MLHGNVFNYKFSWCHTNKTSKIIPDFFLKFFSWCMKNTNPSYICLLIKILSHFLVFIFIFFHDLNLKKSCLVTRLSLNSKYLEIKIKKLNLKSLFSYWCKFKISSMLELFMGLTLELLQLFIITLFLFF